MKAPLLLLSVMGAALLTSGCSTITSRSEPRTAKAYPAVREHWKSGTGPLGKGDLALLAVGCRAADLAVAVSVDTLMLPYDLLHKPMPQPSGEMKPRAEKLEEKTPGDRCGASGANNARARIGSGTSFQPSINH